MKLPGARPVTRGRLLWGLLAFACVTGAALAWDDSGVPNPLRVLSLIVSGPTTMNGDLTVNGDAGVSNNARVNGTFGVNGTSTFGSALSAPVLDGGAVIGTSANFADDVKAQAFIGLGGGVPIFKMTVDDSICGNEPTCTKLLAYNGEFWTSNTGWNTTGYTRGGDAGYHNVTHTGLISTSIPSGDGISIAVDAVEIQWASANANIRGNASGTQTGGTWTAAGEIQAGSDGYRVAGTAVYDVNAHAADGTTGYTWDRSTDLTTGNFGCWRDNGTTSLACLSWAGNVVLQSTDSTGSPGAATINKPCGRSAVAAGASAVTITNSTVAATSNIQVTPLSSSATDCTNWYVSAVGAGSFTLTCPGGNVAATWSFAWCAFGAM